MGWTKKKLNCQKCLFEKVVAAKKRAKRKRVTNCTGSHEQKPDDDDDWMNNAMRTKMIWRRVHMLAVARMTWMLNHSIQYHFYFFTVRWFYYDAISYTYFNSFFFLSFPFGSDLLPSVWNLIQDECQLFFLVLLTSMRLHLNTTTAQGQWTKEWQNENTYSGVLVNEMDWNGTFYNARNILFRQKF